MSISPIEKKVEKLITATFSLSPLPDYRPQYHRPCSSPSFPGFYSFTHRDRVFTQIRCVRLRHGSTIHILQVSVITASLLLLPSFIRLPLWERDGFNTRVVESPCATSHFTFVCSIDSTNLLLACKFFSASRAGYSRTITIHLHFIEPPEAKQVPDTHNF